MNHIEITKSWIEKFVIGLNLCPFAAHPFQKGKIRFRLEKSDTLEDLIKVMIEELLLLKNISTNEVETSVLIHPNVLNEFLDYNDFLADANIVLEKMDLEGEIQIASFHPDYQFAGESKDAVSNYVTRSPFPMLHFLREESVERAIKTHSNTEQIPLDNINHLEKLGLKTVKRISESLFQNSNSKTD